VAQSAEANRGLPCKRPGIQQPLRSIRKTSDPAPVLRERFVECLTINNFPHHCSSAESFWHSFFPVSTWFRHACLCCPRWRKYNRIVCRVVAPGFSRQTSRQPALFPSARLSSESNCSFVNFPSRVSCARRRVDWIIEAIFLQLLLGPVTCRINMECPR